VDKQRARGTERKVVAPLIDLSALEWYAENFDTPTGGASLILESFPALYLTVLSDLRGRFTEAEARLILDALNGLLLTPRLVGSHLELEVHDAVKLNGLDEKGEVDGKALLTKLRALTRFDRAVIEMWARAFWVGGDREQYPAGRYNDADFEQRHIAMLVGEVPPEKRRRT